MSLNGKDFVFLKANGDADWQKKKDSFCKILKAMPITILDHFVSLRMSHFIGLPQFSFIVRGVFIYSLHFVRDVIDNLITFWGLVTIMFRFFFLLFRTVRLASARDARVLLSNSFVLRKLKSVQEFWFPLGGHMAMGIVFVRVLQNLQQRPLLR